jgi:hypothetical protein
MRAVRENQREAGVYMNGAVHGTFFHSRLVRVIFDVEVDLGIFYKITKGNGTSPARSDAGGS